MISDALTFARQQVGKPYTTDWARRFGPDAYDCSGLVCQSLWHGGMPSGALPTNSADMCRYLRAHPELRLDRATARRTPGALTLLGGVDGYGPKGHVELSLGDGTNIGSTGSGGVGIRAFDRLPWGDFMLAPAIDYALPAPPPPIPHPSPHLEDDYMLLMRGDTNPPGGAPVYLVAGNTKLHLTADQPGKPGTYGPWLLFCVANIPGSVDPTTHREWVVPQRMLDAIPAR